MIEFPDFSIYDILDMLFWNWRCYYVTFCEFDIDDTFPLSKAYPQKKFEYSLEMDFGTAVSLAVETFEAQF